MDKTQTGAEEKQIKIYQKMSADKKITIVDEFFAFAKELENENQTIPRRNKPNLRRA